MDAGVEAGEGGRPGRGLRDVRGEHRAAQGAARRRASATCPTAPAAARAADVGRRRRPCRSSSRDPVRVLLTGAAGFIGTAIGARARRRAATRSSRVDVLLPQAHGSPRRGCPRACTVLDVRDAAEWADLLDGVDVVCHQAAMVGAGVTVADLPLYAAHNDLGTAALLAAMHERGVRRAGARVVDGRLRRGALRLPRARRSSRRAAVASTALECRRLREPLPGLRRAAGLAARRRGRRGSTRAAATPRARSPRSTTRRRGRGRPAPRPSR